MSRHARLAGAALLLSALVSAGACRRADPAAFSIVLVTLDTTRADRFGVRELVVGEDRVRESSATVDLEVAGAPLRVDAGPLVYR